MGSINCIKVWQTKEGQFFIKSATTKQRIVFVSCHGVIMIVNLDLKIQIKLIDMFISSLSNKHINSCMQTITLLGFFFRN